MSWDIVGKAVETVISNAIGGIIRLGPLLTVPSLPASSGPGQSGGADSPPPPPAPPAEAEGPAAEAAKEEARRMGEMLEQLVELDNAGISVEDVAAAGEAGRKELEDIRADVNAKITEMKADGSLYTVEGQKALMEFIKTRLEEAKDIIEKAAADSEDKAAEAEQNGNNYGGVGTPVDGGGSHDHGAASGNDAAVEDDSAEEAATTPAGILGQPGLGMGMPMGGGMPLGGGLPGFGGGGGGLPGFGGGGLPSGLIEPLAAGLSGLGEQEPVEPLELKDDDAHGPDDAEGPELKDEHGGPDGDAAAEDAGDAAAAEDDEAAQTQAAAADQSGQQAETLEPPAKSTDVQLPDESVTEARTAQGAAAVRAALNGTPVAEAWQQAAGVALPPAGTPVTEPVPPTQLKAGDVGMWKDHMVMALGSGKVLVSGQVQPLESVSSGPDFLGWFDPTAAAGKTGSPTSAPTAD
ncbi:DUF4226 domain-containing protein [Mycobacterium sp. SMC-4]|jgi:hypothetical protein|uniref:DUF4226 domain-containing protein n=1 Tax=Mycobacterium sp. SMC-4 TaxID=2857059 RepID=UPI0021B449C6|nr:DUF4226 domain-containing protein [Mycobacterium sp. SMC-4]UXA21294.1 DUF4226 domain-containing protein [Mycobacterium sp. SMC-4]